MNSEDRRLILIIDGSKNLHSLWSEVLGNNFHVIESNSGEEGLILARQLSPDLVICDVSISSPGGLAICTKLKLGTATNHIPIILLGPGSREIEGLRTGADDYILIPFDNDVLQLKIENLIRLRGIMRGKFVQEMSVVSEPKEPGDAFLKKMEQLVFENISDPNFGVHEMAFQIGISVSVLYRKLRLLTGVTVNEFVKSVRMNRALKLLETGVYLVNEVAASVGYEDNRYFSKEFRKFFGMTPTEVKRRVNK